jgi:uncharacterized protein YjbI with pentapeptide repeats
MAALKRIGTDLSKADLSKADLSKADLSKADLSKTDLSKTGFTLDWRSFSNSAYAERSIPF